MSTTRDKPTPRDAENLRKALGLSTLQMARAVGLEGENDTARDRWNDMENGRKPISGPASVVLRYLQQGSNDSGDSVLTDLIDAAFPRFLECSDLENEDGTQMAMHTRWPRFYAIESPPDTVVDDSSIESLQACGAEVHRLPAHIGGGHMAILWIDEPIDRARADRAVAECIALTVTRAESDLSGDY